MTRWTRNTLRTLPAALAVFVLSGCAGEEEADIDVEVEHAPPAATTPPAATPSIGSTPGDSLAVDSLTDTVR